MFMIFFVWMFGKGKRQKKTDLFDGDGFAGGPIESAEDAAERASSQDLTQLLYIQYTESARARGEMKTEGRDEYHKAQAVHVDGG
jgi:hypothetical protein